MISSSKLIFSFYYNYRCSVITFHNINRFKYYFSQSDNSRSIDKPLIKITEKDLTPINSNVDDSEIKTVGSIQHKLRLSQYNRKHDIDFYIRLIMKAAKVADTKKILTVFFHDMLITDRMKPTYLLIHIILKKLAELGGHSEAAFKIVRKMSEIRMPPTSVTYSLLFKNCAKEIANNELYYNIANDKTVELLSSEEIEKIQQPAMKAFELWQRSDRTEWRNNAVNSLLLALSRARMLRETFVVLDEFVAAGHRPCDYTLSAMLEGCLHDRKSGFGLALLVFHRLVYQYRCPISPYVMSTMMKVVENCQLGNALIVDNVIRLSSSPLSQHSFLALHDMGNDSSTAVVTSGERGPEPIHCASKRYNEVICSSADKYGLRVSDFVEPHWSPTSSLVYALKSPTNMLQKKFDNVFDRRWLQSKLTPSEKLVCIGGIFGVIGILEQNCMRPNVVVLTSLISCLPYEKIAIAQYQSEEFFGAVIKRLAQHFKIPPEKKFQNALYKRTGRGNDDSPEEINPSTFDPYTWSIYGRKCRTVDDVKKFFQLLEANDVMANKEIYFTVMRSLSAWGPRLHLLQRMQKARIPFDRALVVEIEHSIDKTRQKIKSLTVPELENQNNFSAFYAFQRLYSQVLDNMEIEPVTTGDRKIVIGDLPDQYTQRS